MTKTSHYIKNHKGSVSVECAMALPIFMILCLTLFSMLEMIHVHSRINSALHTVGREVSLYSYTLKDFDRDVTNEEGKVYGLLSAETYARSRLVSILGKDWIKESIVVGGEWGLHFYRSKVDWEHREIDYIVTYKVAPWISYGNLGTIQLINRCRVRMWTGYRIEDETQERYVYITPNGEVYHDSLYCAYLNPSIHSVAFEQIDSKRNKDQGKYYPCESCFQKKDAENSGVVFVTDYGNRYHSALSCKSLKRTIRKVKRSEVGGRPACDKCRID